MPASISDSESPILLFICGPTGSGKSLLVDKTLEYIGKLDILGEGNQNFKSYDNIIETNSLYKRLMFALYYYHFTDTSGNLISDKEINEKINTHVDVRDYNKALKLDKLKFEKPQDNGKMALADYASSIYYAFRNRPSCEHTEIGGATCSRIYDKSIKDLIQKNESVAIETNATKGYKDFVGWYKDFTETNPDFLKKYKVIYSYAFVEFCENIRRIKLRFTSGLKKFITHYIKKLNEETSFTEKTSILDNLKTEFFNDKENAVRLPEIDITTFGNKIEKIRDTLLQSIKCLGVCNDVDIPKKFKPENQRVIIFNTIKKESEVMYDSADSTLKHNDTTNIYNDVKEKCGGRKRTKRRKKLKKKKISNKTRQKKRKKMVRIR